MKLKRILPIINFIRYQVVRQFGRMCIRMVRFCRFADALRMLG